MREEYKRELYEQSAASKPVNPEFMVAYYIVKIGETMKPESMPIYYNRTSDARHLPDVQNQNFDEPKIFKYPIDRRWWIV